MFQAHFIRCFKSISSWHRAFQAYFIRRFKFISSCHIECFKLISSDVSSLFLLVECHLSRLTSDSDLLHSRACFFHVIEADSLSSDELNWWDQSLFFDSCLLHACSKACSAYVIVADSLWMSFKQTCYWFMFTTCM